MLDRKKARCLPSAESSGDGFQSGPPVWRFKSPRDSPEASSTRMDQTLDSELEDSSARVKKSRPSQFQVSPLRKRKSERMVEVLPEANSKLSTCTSSLLPGQY